MIFYEYKECMITAIKCFIILLFFGILLPKIMDLFLYNFFMKNHVYENSTLVFNRLNLKVKLIYNYILVFSNFFKGF